MLKIDPTLFQVTQGEKVDLMDQRLKECEDGGLPVRFKRNKFETERHRKDF